VRCGQHVGFAHSAGKEHNTARFSEQDRQRDARVGCVTRQVRIISAGIKPRVCPPVRNLLPETVANSSAVSRSAVTAASEREVTIISGWAETAPPNFAGGRAGHHRALDSESTPPPPLPRHISYSVARLRDSARRGRSG
jgi:hypothetical protein